MVNFNSAQFDNYVNQLSSWSNLLPQNATSRDQANRHNIGFNLTNAGIWARTRNSSAVSKIICQLHTTANFRWSKKVLSEFGCVTWHVMFVFLMTAKMKNFKLLHTKNYCRIFFFCLLETLSIGGEAVLTSKYSFINEDTERSLKCTCTYCVEPTNTSEVKFQYTSDLVSLFNPWAFDCQTLTATFCLYFWCVKNTSKSCRLLSGHSLTMNLCLQRLLQTLSSSYFLFQRRGVFTYH